MVERGDFSRRLAALRDRLDRDGLPGIMIAQPENRRYLSGFTGQTGALVITLTHALLLTDFIHFEQAGHEAPDFEVVRFIKAADTLQSVVKRLGVARLAFESRAATVADKTAWSEALPDVELIPVQEVVEPLRAVKDAEELRAIREAAMLTDRAFAHLVGWLRPGATEQQAALEFEIFVRTHGGEGMAFDIQVAAGPNGAMPHKRPTDRPIHAGEPIVVDAGARVRGYCSDLTRSFCLGEASDQLLKLHDIVLRAQQAALREIRPGAIGRDVDAAARQVITEAGYGEMFGHSTGHGAGLAVHELPRLSRLFTDTLVANQIVTDEPGIYLPGWGGVRIEDLVLVTESGAEVLSRASKAPVFPSR